MGHDGLRLGLRLEARGGMRGLERVGIGTERAANHPVVLGDEREALALARHDEGERGSLHATRRAHVAVAGELHERQVAREHRAPDEVDVLARGAGGGEVHVELDEVVEGVRDLLFRERRVAGARHGRRGVHFLDAAERVASDELALAVEVGGDDDRVGLLREVLQGADDLLLLGQLVDGRVHEVRQRVHLPGFQLHAVLGEGLLLFERGLRQRRGQLRRKRFALPSPALLVHHRRREVGLQDVAAQADGHPFLAVHVEAVHRRRVHLVRLGFLHAKQIGDLLSRVVLLGYHQLHAVPSCSFRPPPAALFRSHGCPTYLLTCAGMGAPSSAHAPRRSGTAGVSIHDFPRRAREIAKLAKTDALDETDAQLLAETLGHALERFERGVGVAGLQPGERALLHAAPLRELALSEILFGTRRDNRIDDVVLRPQTLVFSGVFRVFHLLRMVFAERGHKGRLSSQSRLYRQSGGALLAHASHAHFRKSSGYFVTAG